MRGNLSEREPEILRLWEELDIYARVRICAGAPNASTTAHPTPTVISTLVRRSIRSQRHHSQSAKLCAASAAHPSPAGTLGAAHRAECAT